MTQHTHISPLRDPRQISLSRALVGAARSILQDGPDSASDLVRKAHPDDSAAYTFAKAFERRSAVTLPDTGNLTTFNRKIIRDLADICGQSSAWTTIAGRAVPISFDDAQAVFVPFQSAANTYFNYVKHGDPAPVRDYDLSSGIMMTAGKQFVGISVFTEETFTHTNADVITRAKMVADAEAAVESLAFDAEASDDARPAGFRNGVAKITATSGGGATACLTDLGLLGAAVASCGPEVIYVAGPGTALRAKLLAPFCPYPILPSRGVAENMVLAVAPAGVVVASRGDPRIDISRTATLHMESSPAQLATSGAASFPQRSLFQTRCVSIKVVYEHDWGLRGPACAWTDSISW